MRIAVKFSVKSFDLFGYLVLSAAFLGCTLIPTQEEKRTFTIEKDWIRPAPKTENMGVRKTVRFAPLISDNSLIVANGVDGVSSWNRETGNVQWRFPVQNGVEGGIGLVKDRLFFGGSDGQFYSINTSGKLLWSFPTRAENLSEPLIAEGNVYFLAGNNMLFSLDAESGRQNWVYSRQETVPFSVRGGAKPLLLGSTLYAGFSDGVLVGLEASKGTVKWEKILNRGKKFKDLDSSIVSDGLSLFVAGYDDAIYSVAPTTGEINWKLNKGAFGAVTWSADRLWASTSQGEVICLDRASGKEIWTQKLKYGIGNQPVLYKGLVIVGESSGSLRFFDSASGKPVGSFEPGKGLSAPVAIHEKTAQLYFVSNESNIYALKVSWEKKL